MQAIFVNMDSPKLEYELSLVIGLFFREYEVTHDAYGAYDGILTVLTKADGAVEVTLEHLDLVPNRVCYHGTVRGAEDKAFKHWVKRELYLALRTVRESISPWGTLVGIRPVKIVHDLLCLGESSKDIRATLKTLYLIEDEKIDLLMEVALRERPHLYPVDELAVSIYISIPFCPTRCVYCSFPSNPIAQKRKLITPYLECLTKEIAYASKVIYNSGRYIDCVYIGGGTPTSLEVADLEKVIKALQASVRMSEVKEFTVEAGRPDTITLEKLQMLKANGVDRICVNPQSMHDETLKAIGRSHTRLEIDNTMALVKSVGFKTVNMDLIIGLADEGVKEVDYTLQEVLKWSPENVTVHTLALKRASELNRSVTEDLLNHDKKIKEMMAHADGALRHAGITPYYMYRQKKMIGHLENVGYAVNGHTSLYNMRIIEERHTIMALGAGATSKICYYKENRHERIANFKSVEDYIQRFDEILKKKDVYSVE